MDENKHSEYFSSVDTMQRRLVPSCCLSLASAHADVVMSQLKWGFPKIGYPFGGPHKKDCSILGSILGYLLKRTFPEHAMYTHVFHVHFGFCRNMCESLGIFNTTFV